jgi:hypothetical protein
MAGFGQKRRGQLLAVGVAVLAVLSLGLYGARVQRQTVAGLVDAAAQQGVKFELGQIHRSLWRLNVSGSRFSLRDMPNLRGTIGELSVGLPWSPAVAHGVSVRLQGEPLDCYERWVLWQAKRAQAGSAAQIRWHGAAVSLLQSWGPAIAVAGATAARAPRGYTFAVTQLSVGSLTWNAVDGIIEPRQAGLEIGFGDTTLSQAPVRLLHFRTPPVSRITLTVRPKRLADLLDQSRVPLAHPRAREMRALGTLSLVVKDDEDTVRGRLGLTFDHFPHPQLLAPGKLFGGTAAFSARFEAGRGLSVWQLPFVQATLPPFTLRGEGRLEREGRGVRVRATLFGRRDCSRLARLLDESVLREQIRENVEAAAGQVLPPLDVTLQLDLATERLDQATVSWQIGAGCGLEPLAQDPPVQLELRSAEPH